MFKIIWQCFQEAEKRREEAILKELEKGECSGSDLALKTRIGVHKIYPILQRLESTGKISSRWDWPYKLRTRARRRLYRLIITTDTPRD